MEGVDRHSCAVATTKLHASLAVLSLFSSKLTSCSWLPRCSADPCYSLAFLAAKCTVAASLDCRHLSAQFASRPHRTRSRAAATSLSLLVGARHGRIRGHLRASLVGIGPLLTAPSLCLWLRCRPRGRQGQERGWEWGALSKQFQLLLSMHSVCEGEWWILLGFALEDFCHLDAPAG